MLVVGDVSMTARTIKVEVSVWFNEATGHIHLAGPGFITTVNDKPGSERRHANLFGKLARLLSEANAPAPLSSHEQRAAALASLNRQRGEAPRDDDLLP